ncbi:MAG: branched-chain amino acid ABC transporter substrate-binding protein [Proteobacteria bacterium]|nr:branched-chain amino acid ABC transporter substrate-binding protein [Pseudomonadota bacterium]
MKTKLRGTLVAGVLGAGLGLALAAMVAPTAVLAQAKSITIGINLPLTGADAESAKHIRDGSLMAIDEINAKGGVAGYKLETMILDDATATAGQYDPAQAATNAKKFVANASVLVALGPQMSGSGKAMSPILSAANLPIITPSSTNPDITDPKFASTYRPGGKAIYFRTVTTDAFQGPNMANYYADVLKAKSVYILDDSGAYGVGIANSFQGQAEKKGIKILGRDQLNPKEADYTTILTKIKALNPDALYYGGVGGAGVKLAKQAFDVIPKMVKGGGDGMYGPDILKGAGFPASNGWYATLASPHVSEDPKIEKWAAEFRKKYGYSPEDYTITSYDATLVIADSIERVVKSGKELNRANMRDAIQAAKLMTLQGEVSFDEHGDINNRVVSVFQINHDTKFPDDDTVHQYKYIGVAASS